MDYKKIAEIVEKKSGVKIEDAICMLVDESCQEEREKREDRLEKIYKDVCRQLFESKERVFVKRTVRGYLEDILSVMQYIEDERNSTKRDIAIDLLEERIRNYNKVLESEVM